MKKFLLPLAMVTGCVVSAGAVAWLPTPEVISENVVDGGVNISWTYDDSETACSHFQVIVYKMHKAEEAGPFVLAETDFSNIESSGTMSKHEERGATWDFIPGCPGWWVKFPQYMNGAMGIDAFYYFAGSDNADIFGGAYMISPDYDLTHLTDPSVKVEAKLANESTSVTGGFALWCWNTNWFDPKNIDYKPVYNCDIHYSDLASTSWSAKEETLAFPNISDFTDPDDLDEIEAIDKSRTRVMFYGSGYSAYWIDDLKISVDMAPGDMVDYGAEILETADNSITIDTSADTSSDYVYAYEIRPVYTEFDDYRNVTTIRFTNYAYSSPRHIIGQFSSVENVSAEVADVKIVARDGLIFISGAGDEAAQVYDVSGQCVYNGSAAQPISLDGGIYIVRVAGKAVKVAL